MDEKFPKDVAEQSEGLSEKAELEKLFDKINSAPGYVVFVGTLENTTGGLQLNFDYRRFNLSIEDARMASKAMVTEVQKDFNGL